MDPDATLAEIRALIKAAPLDECWDRLAELIESLDEWISRGGFLPSDWDQKQWRN